MNRPDYFNTLFASSGCSVSIQDYDLFEPKQKLLYQLSEVENSSMAVFDMNKGQYAFVRSKFDDLLNYPFNEAFRKNAGYFLSLMPPPDIRFTLDTIKKTFAFLAQQDKNEIKNYKLIFEFRLSDTAGNLYRFLQQCVVLEQDKNGKIWMVLIINDMVPGRPEGNRLMRKLMHMPTGKICLFNDEPFSSSQKFLSKRETQILGLLSQGLQSKEISAKLFISVNTVNNHRQKIIEKLNSENTWEALRLARSIGII